MASNQRYDLDTATVRQVAEHWLAAALAGNGEEKMLWAVEAFANQILCVLNREDFPGMPGSLWRDTEGDLWVLCADGRMWKIDELEEPDSPTELAEHFGPLTHVDGAS